MTKRKEGRIVTVIAPVMNKVRECIQIALSLRNKIVEQSMRIHLDSLIAALNSWINEAMEGDFFPAEMVILDCCYMFTNGFIANSYHILHFST